MKSEIIDHNLFKVSHDGRAIQPLLFFNLKTFLIFNNMLLVEFCIKVDRFSFCEENISRAWLQLYSSEQKLNVFFVSFVKNEKRKSEIMSFQRRLNRLKNINAVVKANKIRARLVNCWRLSRKTLPMNETIWSGFHLWTNCNVKCKQL